MTDEVKAGTHVKVVILEYVMPAMIGLLGYIGLAVVGDLDKLDNRMTAAEIQLGKQVTITNDHARRLNKLEK